VEGVRGVPWAICAPDGGPPHMLLSYGTLTAAVYVAHEREPTNSMVHRTVRQGLKSAVVLQFRTPPDVVDYLIKLHNSFHDGSGTSFIEVLSMVAKIEAEWKSHCITTIAQGLVV
jgi:hypothetical protein